VADSLPPCGYRRLPATARLQDYVWGCAAYLAPGIFAAPVPAGAVIL